MTKTLAQATVAELDAIAAEHDVADYPADGLKADKLAALEEALGEDFTFEVEDDPVEEAEPVPDVVWALADGFNGADFAHPETDVQVHLDAGESLTVSANFTPVLREIPFLEAQEA